ncbi:radical SAM/SPASM domain-containing protein [Thioflexithrix psekupsensis]|uniref:Radical SAM core domain-containing protein n=1 Tax=Thioflexithrix psekupsensis TaxID=1570016 RepID=A0A251XBE7_9GAMM|nr:radical SAM protein [Thioflexithrix psekupsensis]OUD15654.1 hypothetical protein TPSD3_03805 [Thioflexithrix psekupsensis]
MSSDNTFSKIIDYTKKHELPFFAHWEIISKCNLKCKHCFVDKTDNVYPSTEEALNIVKYLYSAGVFNVTLSGGEPLLHPGFSKIYTSLKDVGMRVTVFTNAVALSEETFKLFERLPPVGIEVSLYGVDEKTFFSLTSKKNVFDKLLRKLERLTKISRVLLKAPIMTENISYVDKFIQICDELNVRYQFAELIFPMLDGDKKNLDQRPPVGAVVEKEFSDFHTLNDWKERVAERGFSKEAYLRCSAGLNSIVINPDSSLSMCGMLRGFKFKFDSQDTFNTAISSLRNTRKEIENYYSKGSCHTCKYANLCVGCPALSFMENGTYTDCVS